MYDSETLMRYAGELDEESYERLYFKMVKESSDMDGDGDKDTIVGKIALKLINLLHEKLDTIKTINISESNGDLRKLKYNRQLKAIKKIIETFQKSQGMSKKYGDMYLNVYKLLEKRRREFRKAFKHSSDNLLSLFYVGLVLYLVEMSTIISSTMIDWLEEAKDMDVMIDEKPEYKEVFLKAQGMIEDKDLNKFFKVDFSKSLIAESGVSGEVITLYSETSINDTLRLFSLGLAKLLHKLTGFLRYVIYLFHYNKFSLDKKIEKINNVLELYDEQSGTARKQKLNTAKKQDRDYKVSTMEATDEAKKEMSKEKIDLEDSSGFGL